MFEKFYHKNAWSKLWEDITEGGLNRIFKLGCGKKQFQMLLCVVFSGKQGKVQRHF